MSTFDAASIKVGNTLNLEALIASINSLAVKWGSTSHAGLQTVTGGTTNFATVHTLSGIVCAADEFLEVTSIISCSANNLSDTWYIRHNISGETLTTGNRGEFNAKVVSSFGKSSVVAIVTPFENLSGTKSVILEVGNSDVAPTGNFYTNVGRSFWTKKKKG